MNYHSCDAQCILRSSSLLKCSSSFESVSTKYDLNVLVLTATATFEFCQTFFFDFVFSQSMVQCYGILDDSSER